jgi:hypothetical protein
MIAPLADQAPRLPNRTMAQIQHQFGLAIGAPAQAGREMVQVVRQLSEDGHHISLVQARTFINHLCDRIPKSEARQHFRTCVGNLIRQQTLPPGTPIKAFPVDAAQVSRGRTHDIIQAIINARSRGNPNHVNQIKSAFRRYGIDPDQYGANTRDDPKIVARLEHMAHRSGIALPLCEKRRTAAELRRLLDAIIKERHGDAPDLARHLTNQLRLKGIHPGKKNDDRSVSAHTLDQLQRLAEELGIDTTQVHQAHPAPITRGRIRQMLDHILRDHSPDGRFRIQALQTKLLLRGIDPQAFTYQTPDDPAVLRQVQEIADRLGIVP